MRETLAILLLVAAPAGAASCSGDPGPEGPAETEAPRRVPAFAWVSPRVARGGEPVGEAAFAELAERGIRTIVSVEGARPDAEAARRHGLRTVHIPIGYGGPTREQLLSLAKTVRELPGPFFVHGRRGRHRGPTAAVLAAMTLSGLPAERGLAELRRAGTAERYEGLFAAVRGYAPPGDAATRAHAFDFPAAAEVSGVAAAMAAIDRILDRLKASRSAVWTPPPEHPDLDPPREVLRMVERFVELLRTGEAAARGEEFAGGIHRAVAALQEIDVGLRRDVPDPEAIEPAWRRLLKACSDCHRRFRDVPPGK